MSRKDNKEIHKIIYIDDEGKAIDKKRFQRVIFVGDNEILKRIKIKKVVFPMVLSIFMFSLIYTSIMIHAWQKDGQNTKELTKTYIDLASITEENTSKDDLILDTVIEGNKDLVGTGNYYYKFDTLKMMNVNFDKLLNINSETVAWLKVPGTKINYPVTHTVDNEFYLSHTYDKSKNTVGWVFLDFRNNGNLNNRNNIIYAHGRLDNVMFGTLKNVLDDAWYKDESNRIIKTSTPNHNDLWEVFSVYVVESESYYIKTSFEDNLDFYEFIQTISNRSKYKFDVDVTFTDRILTLSTCYNDAKRIVVHAKLIATQNRITEEETPVDENGLPITPTEETTEPKSEENEIPSEDYDPTEDYKRYKDEEKKVLDEEENNEELDENLEEENDELDEE